MSIAVIESMVLRLYSWGGCLYCGCRNNHDRMSCRSAYAAHTSTEISIAGIRRAIEVSSVDVIERLASCR